MAFGGRGDAVRMRQPQFSAMRQPPLIRQLRGILAEYPDGGQILKELIQNAEDAGARDMSILLDAGRTNRDAGDKAPVYTKFFQAPALCVYNDAVFTDKDWEGITMIYSSIKEEDKSKVGRFGLGFKSVFHITDYPCIISGDKMLLIDPQQPTDRVNAFFEIPLMHDPWEGLDMNDFYNGLGGYFGVDQRMISDGHFNGTLFWFPLRERASPLSETLYDERKILDLLDGLKSEAPSILIFLRNLESLTVFTAKECFQRTSTFGTHEHNRKRPSFHVRIKDAEHQVRHAREEFIAKMDTNSSDVTSMTDYCIEVTTDGQVTDYYWAVLNYFVGTSASGQFLTLINDKDISMSPCVSIAVSLDQSRQQFEGHIYCFMPLPKEGSKLTGLPFHVNGFFALSQNRHHLKWVTDEQKMQKIYDKNVLWNQYMVTEALPKAFKAIYLYLVHRAQRNGNPNEDIMNINRLIPDFPNVLDKWRQFMFNALSLVKSEKIFFCRHLNAWIQLQQSSFASFDNLPRHLDHVRSSVKKCLQYMGQYLVEVPDETVATFKQLFPGQVTDVTPLLLARYMRQNMKYMDLDDKAKLNILEYLVSDADNTKLENLHLILLASRDWAAFHQRGEPIYICDEKIISLFPLLANRFLAPDARETVYKSGLFQLTEITETAIKTLLQETMSRYLDFTDTVSESSPINVQWLENVWRVIGRNINNFTALSLVPYLQSGSFLNKYRVKLIPLRTPFLVLGACRGATISKELVRPLELLGITVLPDVPSFVHQYAGHFLNPPYLENLVQILNEIAASDNQRNHIANFNKLSNDADKETLFYFLQSSTLNEHGKTFITSLNIFPVVHDSKTKKSFSDLRAVNKFVELLVLKKVPNNVTLPFPCVLAGDQQRRFLQTLRVTELTLEQLLEEKLMKLSVTGYTEENTIIMEFFLSKIGSFQSNSRLLKLAAKIPFILIGNVRVKASDLFDSLDRNIERLFVAQDNLYENRQALTKYRTGLKMIGLKSYDKISVDDIYSVATTLHNWSTNKDHLEHIVDKAKAFQEYIETNPEILQMLLRSSVTLGEAIRNLQCFINYKEMFDGAGELCKQSVSLCMPSSLKIMQQWKIICLVRPVIESRCGPLTSFYQWHKEPSVDDVLENLKRVKKVISKRKYEQTLRSMVFEAFQYLHQRLRESIERKQAFVQNALIWTEEGFCTPDRAIIEREGVISINLSPYFKFIPREFEHLRDLFLEIGCNLTEEKTVLARFLHDIREKYLQEYITGDEGFDRTRVSSVLDRLANENIDEEWLQSNVIIMVESTENRIEFAELTACVYDDEPEMYMEASDEDAQFKFVHPSLNHQTLFKLGVKSVTRSCLLAAEDVGIEEWGQNEQLTTRLNNILIDSYTDGLSVPKELIQNADDAHATQLSFLYDERKNNDAKERLLSKQLEECQGPALWVYNDAVFTKDDLKNITKLHGATKKSKKTIGKFGLGFCSVYNLTDVPSFISGGYLVMFDPHGTYLQGVDAKLRSGIRIPLSKQMLIKRHEDQFKPYEGIFGCNLLSESLQNFNKSLFRLPLRTAKQADVSEISKKVYNNAEVKELLSMFMKTAGNLLLFCQNVKTINLYHIQDGMSVTEASLCYTVRKPLIPFLSVGRNIIQDAGEHFDQNKILNINETVHIEQELYPCNIWHETPCKTKNQSTWLVTWNMNPREHITPAIEHFPLTAVATPVDKTTRKILQLHKLPSGYYNEGHLFCFLPLPVRTGLQFHINGFFNVTSDRKGLFVKTEDDKSDPGKIKWNNELLAKSVVKAFTDHLLLIVSMDLRCEGNLLDVYDLWPEKDKDVIGPFIAGFYRRVIEENIPIFRGRDSYYAFNEILMLDATIPNKLEDICYNMLINIPIDQSKSVIRIPKFVYENIQKYNKEKEHLFTDAVLSMTKILPFFLCSIESPYWADKEEERNYLLRYAVLQDDPDIVEALNENRCFPTEPNGTLKKVSELVRHDSNIAHMYHANEEIFISLKSGLREQNIMLKLIQLGMQDKFLPAHMLLGRCQSVLKLSVKCVECCRSRIKCILSYLKTTEGQRALVETDELNSVKSTCFLPVLTTPTDWKFSWRAESCEHIVVCDTNKRCKMHSISSTTLLLGQPKHLFPYSFRLCAGTVECIFDELFDGHTPQALINLLGLADSKLLSIDILVRQLDCLATEFTSSHDHYNQTTQRIYESIYSAFDRLSMNLTDQQVEESIKSSSKTILTKPIVLVDDTVVCPCKVVFDIKRSCPPDLFGLHNLSESQKRVFHKFGVKSECSVDDIIHILKQKKDKWKEKRCNEVQRIVNLLINLENGMSIESKTFDDIHVDDRNFIVAPNSDGYLHPTHMLAIEDPEILTSKGLMLLHGDIAPNLASKIGVQTKKVQFLQSISTAVPFGQREKLTTRLRGLLKDYPCDGGIMKEMIQNADDAGATEIHFIKFYGRHESKRAKSLEHIGHDLPALCVFNNSCFSKEDFIGIQNLGKGSKSEDPTKTGQFGVGFNAVYHLTDCPSFWTKGPGLDEEGELVLFDPLLKSIGEYSRGEPGIRIKVKDLNKEFPGTLKNYPPLDCRMGTMFRLPLRTNASLLSKHCISEEMLNDIMFDFTRNTADCLHFLKHITCIKFMTYKEGKLSEDYKVKTLLSSEDERKRSMFFTKVKSVCEQNKRSKLGNLSVDQFETTYKMTIISSNSANVQWLVTNTFGVKQSEQPLNERITHAFNEGDLGLLPFSGVSVRLHKDSVKCLIESRLNEKYQNKTITEISPIQGVAYCFLPLPVCTGMPFNINGHFALDRGRRGLWDEGYRKSWNEFVLSCLVADALNAALLYLQKYFGQDCKDILHRQSVMNEYLSLYYQHFPCLPMSKGAYWKQFVTSFYQRVFTRCFAIFAAVRIVHTTEGRTSVKLDWVFPSVCDSDDKGGIFNVVRYFVKGSNLFYHKHVRNIEITIQEMGIKLIQVPKSILDTLHETKITYALYGDPEFVIKHLKKNILPLQPLQESLLQNVEVVDSLLRYVWMAEHFKDEILDLPLCLTNDFILRPFSVISPVFCTKYHSLLPESPDRFVHADLVCLLSQDNTLLELKVVLNFGIPHLLELLPLSYSEIYCHSTYVRWGSTQVKETERVNPGMINSFYNFIKEESTVILKNGPTKQFDYKLFHGNVRKFEDWSFLPSVRSLGENKTFELIPIKHRHHLLYEHHENVEVYTSLRKLNIPSLDTAIFKIPGPSFEIGKMLASTANPSELLKCLVYYKARIAVSNVGKDEVDILLNFFYRHREEIKVSLQERSVYFLKSLPLYEALPNGNFVSVEDKNNLTCIPREMPTEGLFDLTQTISVCFLQKHWNLLNMYSFLKIPCQKPIDIYLSKILPYFDRLPEISWKTHLEYIKNTLLLVPNGRKPANIQNEVLNILRRTPFIRVNGELRRVSELFDKDHEVHKCFLNKDSFLSAQFQGEEWKEFMVQLGLITKPPGDMITRLAKEMARSGNTGVDETIILKSTVLTNCIFGYYGDDFDDITYRELQHIKFVLPHPVTLKQQNIFRSHSKDSIFISLKGTCSRIFEDVCWSSVNLLQEIPDSDRMEKLNILKEPTVDSVITHCQNISEVFFEDFKNGRDHVDDKEYFMEKTYEYLNNRRENLVRHGRLEHTHFVLIPDEKAMVKVSNVFTGSLKEQAIPPYLFQAPKIFRKYFDLFEKMGAKESVSYIHYVSVLKSVKSEFEGVLPKLILYLVSIAVQKLFEQLLIYTAQPSNIVDNSIELFLPNSEQIMSHSANLTVDDNSDLRTKLNQKCAINYFVGFRQMDILKFSDPVKPFLCLPCQKRPKILSDVVSEIVITNEMETVERSAEADSWKRFLHSTEFVEGIIRLLRHQSVKETETRDITVEEETEIMQKLSNVKVSQVTGLKTKLSYKGTLIEGTDTKKTCFVSKMTNEEDSADQEYYHFYFQTNLTSRRVINMLLISEENGLIELVDLCTMGKFSKRCSHIMRDLLDLIENPHEISLQLDRRKIAAYNLPLSFRGSVFPNPGTYVEDRFLPFLVQGIIPFKKHEYMFAALEIEFDDDSEDPENEIGENVTYIYVHILSEIASSNGSIHLGIRYMANVGDRYEGTVEVPIYRLYRFLPQTQESSQDVVVFDTEPVGAIAFDENCRRIREMLIEAFKLSDQARKIVIRRLIKKWHPDKNVGNESYCTRIYNYLRELILRLERGERIDEEIVNATTGMSAPDMSGSSYRTTTERAYQTGGTYARGYRANINEYNRSFRQGHYSHRSSASTPRRSIGESRRWLRQAKQDYSAAKRALECTEHIQQKSYNWICFMCHQACEKALKAVWFSKDANLCPQRVHSLTSIVRGLDHADLQQEATLFEGHLEIEGGQYFKLRYPDCVAGNNIPSDMFHDDDARFAVDSAKRMLDIVDDFTN